MATNFEDEIKSILEIPPKELKETRERIKSVSKNIIAENIERMKKAWPNRPETMQYFDKISNFFGQRLDEIRTEKEDGKKVIGYSCMFAPIELILAADAIPLRVDPGWYDTTKLGDRIMPVEVCPVVRSAIGTQMVSLSPYLELSDAIISPLTCDGKTKLSEVLGNDKTVWPMSLPRIKDSSPSRKLWKREVVAIKDKIETLTGTEITRDRLRDAIELMQGATKAFRRLQKLRKGNPVIMGRDAMLVNQTSMWDDIGRWTKKTEELCDELENRIRQKNWACPPDTPRVMVTGTPMLWPDNWKIPNLIEESTPQGILVADELCSSDRLLYDPVGVEEWTMSDMLDAVAERYLLPSTCPCFTSEHGNEDRINWLLNKIEEYDVDGVIYYVVRGCILYAMEYATIKEILDSINIPIYYLDTEYTREDVGQMKTRVEAFLEMLNTRVALKDVP